MNYWETPGVAGLILVCVLLLGTRAARVGLAGDRPVPIPDALLAGVLGLVLGPSVLGLVPFDPEDLEPIVYHGLALTFIAFGLRASGSDAGPGRKSVRGLTFAIPLASFAQGALGLAFVLAWSAALGPLHPGFGWLLALGFAQGPGQALAMGAVYEQHGLVHGAQLGLTTAAIGFGWAVFVGIPLIALGRHLGWISPAPPPPPPAAASGGTHEGSDLVLHVALVGAVYALTWGLLVGLSSLVDPESPARATLYGFHYVAGVVFAIATRSAIRRLPRGPVLHDGHLAGLAALSVDLTTASALAAIRLDAVADGLVPLLALTTRRRSGSACGSRAGPTPRSGSSTRWCFSGR